MSYCLGTVLRQEDAPRRPHTLMPYMPYTARKDNNEDLPILCLLWGVRPWQATLRAGPRQGLGSQKALRRTGDFSRIAHQQRRPQDELPNPGDSDRGVLVVI